MTILNCQIVQSTEIGRYIYLKILEKKCFWLRVLMPIEKHIDTHPHNIKLPLLLPHHSSPFGKSSTHVSQHFQIDPTRDPWHTIYWESKSYLAKDNVPIGFTFEIPMSRLHLLLDLTPTHVLFSLFKIHLKCIVFQLNHAGN